MAPRSAAAARAPAVLVVLSVALLLVCSAQDLDQTPATDGSRKSTKCYDDFGRPQRCIPEFENAAYNVLMEATNTCGDNGPVQYCVQTGTYSLTKSCEMCYPEDHHSRFLTDLHHRENQTWWQSESMFEGIQFPSQVNLTLNLKKSFDITYVRIWFYSPRPESFAIYKRTREDDDWIPFQFYSASCRDTYHLPDNVYIKGEETRAFCTSEYSDISPLRDGNVAFSTLENRPSAMHFDTSPELQEWVQATDIRISLDRLNTFGDEVFADQSVLRTYFYAISDVAVGARCTCNGHASGCVKSTGVRGEWRRVCSCQHNTAGPDCGECLPFYNDAPWGRASADNAHECKPCNCNGFSDRCFFDKELYARTGHGGHCLDCSANRDGPNCERCRENYFQREDRYCVACNCDATGSRSLQCNSEGRCQCKPGVTGDKCDRCDANHWDFGADGCKACGCAPAGSLANRPACDAHTGVCRCKENVEGRRCGECKPGFFNLDTGNEFGCTPCFCYGHSSECATAPGYSRVTLESAFARGPERWTAHTDRRRPVDLQYNALTQAVGVSAQGYETVYFSAPDRFLGDQRASYNQDLRFTLRIGENGPNPTATDVILEGADTYVTNTIFAQNNPVPSVASQEYRFRLHEHPDYNWQPRLSARAFMSVLSNLTAVRIRGTYTPLGVGFLHGVRLETALRGAAGAAAAWVERCECPQGYVGQFCESCAPGYRHSPALAGPYMPCIPCDCNKHASICDSETGRCICQHNTAGDNCDMCARGFYGNALQGTATDCKPCLCPGGGACMLLHDDTPVCLECPEGYAGPRCDLCSDGYFGDPSGRTGPATECRPCECNQNVDRNAVGNCNRTTGECLKCVQHTAGPHCDRCLAGYYGDALALPRGDCKPCRCHAPGTELEAAGNEAAGRPACDASTGRCRCRPFVRGHDCDRCETGYFDLASGDGCRPCDCDPVGSYNATCDLVTGQCHCRPGVAGLRCDRCQPDTYGFSVDGCAACDCDAIGSRATQCHLTTGQCPCWDNVEGRQCDRCKENKHDRQRGCIDCPACYDLVQAGAAAHLDTLRDFELRLRDVNSSDVITDVADFDEQLRRAQDAVRALVQDARRGATGAEQRTVTERLDSIYERQRQVVRLLDELRDNLAAASDNGSQALRNVTQAEDVIELARRDLGAALEALHTDGERALQRARERARDMGQQSEQMTRLAHEARAHVAKLDAHARDIADVAQQARNVSVQAHDLYKTSIARLQNNTDDVQAARAELAELGAVANATREHVERVHRGAVEAENKTISFFNDVNNLQVPRVNTTEVRANAAATLQEAHRVVNESRKLADQNDRLMENVANQTQRADDLLEEAKEQQLYVAELFSEVDLAHSRADNAVRLGDETLHQARQTYDTLAGFDLQVKASKHSAEEALLQAPEIQQLVDEAAGKHGTAQRTLKEARQNAQTARDAAHQAQREFAEEASRETERIRSEADKMRATAGQLRDEADNLAGRVSVTGLRLQRLQNQTASNGSAIDAAKKMVSQATADTAEASARVADVMRDVQAIADELDGLPDILPQDLDQLENKLAVAERRLADARLDDRMDTLTKERRDQSALISNYRKEFQRLEADVLNIEAILKALPGDKCFRSLELEP